MTDAMAATGGDDARPSSRRLFRLLVAAVVVVGILFAFVNPVRSFVAQRRSIADARAQVEVLDSQSTQLRQRADQLRTDAEVERLGREQYGLVKPGEEAYAILPAPGTVAPVPPPARPPHRSAWYRAWHAVQVWN